MSPRIARMALSLICEAGDPRLPGLLASTQPAAIVDALRSNRRVNGVSVPTAWVHAAQTIEAELERVRSRANAAGLTWVIPGDRAWPQRLDALDHVDPIAGATGTPLGLWVRGDQSLAALVDRGVAIVGARDCTAYGAELAAELAAYAASAGFTVISG